MSGITTETQRTQRKHREEGGIAYRLSSLFSLGVLCVSVVVPSVYSVVAFTISACRVPLLAMIPCRL